MTTIDSGPGKALDTLPKSAPVEGGNEPAQVMSYNIGRGAAGKGAGQDELDQVAAVIAQEGPDVIALQEVHEDDIPMLLEILEQEYGLTYYADFAETLPSGNGSLKPGDEGYDSTRTSPYGIAVLSRNPITTSNHQDLPNPGGYENRVLQQVTTMVDGEMVTVLNTHLSTNRNGDNQAEQTAVLFETAVNIDGPTIITADLNQTPSTLADRAKDASVNGRVDVASDKSSPTVGLNDFNPFNNKTIDYVLVSDDITVVDSDVRDDKVSDHGAVVVDIEI